MLNTLRTFFAYAENRLRIWFLRCTKRSCTSIGLKHAEGQLLRVEMTPFIGAGRVRNERTCPQSPSVFLVTSPPLYMHDHLLSALLCEWRRPRRRTARWFVLLTLVFISFL